MSGNANSGGRNTSAETEALEALLTDWTRAKLDTLGARKRLVQQVRDAYVAATGNASCKQADGIYKCLKLLFEEHDKAAALALREKTVATADAIKQGPEEQEDPFEGYTDTTGALQ